MTSSGFPHHHSLDVSCLRRRRHSSMSLCTSFFFTSDAILATLRAIAEGNDRILRAVAQHDSSSASTATSRHGPAGYSVTFNLHNPPADARTTLRALMRAHSTNALTFTGYAQWLPPRGAVLKILVEATDRDALTAFRDDGDD